MSKLVPSLPHARYEWFGSFHVVVLYGTGSPVSVLIVPMYAKPRCSTSDDEIRIWSCRSSIPPAAPIGSCVCTKRKLPLLFHDPGVAIGSKNRPALFGCEPISSWYAAWFEDWMLKSPPTMKFHPLGSAVASARIRCASTSRRAWSVLDDPAFMCTLYDAITVCGAPYPTGRKSYRMMFLG